MVYKKNQTEKSDFSAEKYIFSIIIFVYIIGICLGCHFIFSDKEHAIFTRYITSKGIFNILIYFLLGLTLKYSGILSSLVSIIPMFIGIQNAVAYCSLLLNKSYTLTISLIFLLLKDTAISFLLILYVTILIYQIINKKYNTKSDIKYLLAYTVGVISIYIINYTIMYLIKI